MTLFWQNSNFFLRCRRHKMTFLSSFWKLLTKKLLIMICQQTSHLKSFNQNGYKFHFNLYNEKMNNYLKKISIYIRKWFQRWTKSFFLCWVFFRLTNNYHHCLAALLLKIRISARNSHLLSALLLRHIHAVWIGSWKRTPVRLFDVAVDQSDAVHRAQIQGRYFPTSSQSIT